MQPCEPQQQEISPDAENIANAVRTPLLLLDRELCAVLTNRAFHDTFHLSVAEIMGKPFFEVKGGQWNIPEIGTLLKNALSQSVAFGEIEIGVDFPDVGPRVTRVFSLSEAPSFETEYEIDLILLDPSYHRLEAFWTPSDLDWVICASHENSLTFAGERLVNVLKAEWPDWHRYTYF